MLRTIILICSLGTDPSECTKETAIDRAALPPTHAAICGIAGQAEMAAGIIAPEPGKSYAKIVCERVKPLEQSER